MFTSEAVSVRAVLKPNSHEASEEVTRRDDQETQREINQDRHTGFRGVRMLDKSLSPLLEAIRPLPFFFSPFSHHCLFNLLEPNIKYASYRKIWADTD